MTILEALVVRSRAWNFPDETSIKLRAEAETLLNQEYERILRRKIENEKQVQPKFTIEDLSEGRCAVINDGTVDELREVLKLAFPKDNFNKGVMGNYKYYFQWYINRSTYNMSNYTNLPTQSVKDFLTNQKHDFVLAGSGETYDLVFKSTDPETGLQIEVKIKSKEK